MSDKFDEMNYLLVFGNMVEEGLEVYHAIGYAEEPSQELMQSDLMDMLQLPQIYPWLTTQQWDAKLFPPGEALEHFKDWMREVKPLVTDMSDVQALGEMAKGHDINGSGTVH